MSLPTKVFEKATEGAEHPRGGGRLVPIASGVIAVFAAFASILGHHASIQALDLRNSALHETIKASDQYTYYQTKRVRVGMYTALLTAGLATSGTARSSLQKTIDHEETTSLAVLGDAKTFESAASTHENRAEVKLATFDTFEIATAMFEIAIVLASISAITRSRLPLWLAFGLSTVGIAALVAGFIQGR